MSAPGAIPSCDCWVATIRILNQCESPFKQLPQSPTSMPFNELLALSQNLVQHWEVMNGCTSSEAHINPQLLRFMADAVGRVLTLHDIVVEGMLLSRQPDDLQRQGRTYGDAGRNCPHATFSLEPNSQACNVADCGDGRACQNATLAFVGSLKLDDEEEVSIVFQEALRHSIIRLGAMLQDIEEEIHQFGPDEFSNVERPLQDTEVKGLIGRLFGVLGRISSLN
ncbi:hypothetical protein GX51_05316 [Blastomyces parvus]|uniref:Uncharacterized protein n=1 Tax=Blastomyces parvus TaxID=2060905 RepID=A0A2B7WXL7_9EURO|nr:hypothetical protein GX51_05316 [Blastomyces parvus]